MEKANQKAKTRRLSKPSSSLALNGRPDFHAVVENLPDGVLIHTDRDIVFANPACVRLFGANDAGQLIGSDFSKFVRPEFMPAIEERLRGCHATGKASAPLETTVVRCDGTTVEVESVAIPILWEAARATEVVLRDISERKKTETAAQNWQKRLELAQKAGLRIGLWDWDVVANTVTWSDETYRQFGFTRDTFSGRVEDATARLHPDDKNRVETAIQEVLDGRSNDYAVQYRLVRPDGTISWIDAHGVMVRNGSVHMLGVGIDITDLKDSAQSLKESEEKYLLLLNSTAEAIYGIDLEGTCTFSNPATARVLGYESPAQLLGKNMHDLLHHTRSDGSSYPEDECHIYAAMRSGQGQHFSSEVLFRRDGTSFHAEYWSHPIFKDGVLVGAVVTFLDISERYRAERALRDSEQKYRSLFDNACYGIFRSKPDGTLLDVNPAFVAMLGYDSRAEMLKCNMTDIYYEPASRLEWLKELGSKERVVGELAWKRKDGKRIHVRVNGRRVPDPNTSDPHLEGMVEDISERRSLEEQLRQAQKMEVVGRLAGGVSHDFNNLLSVILGNAEMLNQFALGSHCRYVNEIQKATRRAADLTRQLLAFSRRQVLFPTVLNLNVVIQETSRMLKRVIGEDINVELALEQELGCTRADRTQVEQILMNLATNARDAMPGGGVLTFKTENVELGGPDSQHPYIKTGSYIRLSVSDTGVGMSDEIQARVFDPFFTTKPPGSGTGLGLATVYGIVKQSGGYIWVHSSPGKGTTFHICLPRVSSVPSIRQPEELALPSFHGRDVTVLLLEDDEPLREITAESLRSRGMQVLCAASGKAAEMLAKQHKKPISLIISDVVLPDVAGPTAVKEMCISHPDAKVMYISGYVEGPVAAGLVSSGATLLQKPLSRLELLHKIDELLKNDSRPNA